MAGERRLEKTPRCLIYLIRLQTPHNGRPDPLPLLLDGIWNKPNQSHIQSKCIRSHHTVKESYWMSQEIDWASSPSQSCTLSILTSDLQWPGKKLGSGFCKHLFQPLKRHWLTLRVIKFGYWSINHILQAKSTF